MHGVQVDNSLYVWAADYIHVRIQAAGSQSFPPNRLLQTHNYITIIVASSRRVVVLVIQFIALSASLLDLLDLVMHPIMTAIDMSG